MPTSAGRCHGSMVTNLFFRPISRRMVRAAHFALKGDNGTLVPGARVGRHTTLAASRRADAVGWDEKGRKMNGRVRVLAARDGGQCASRRATSAWTRARATAMVTAAATLV